MYNIAATVTGGMAPAKLAAQIPVTFRSTYYNTQVYSRPPLLWEFRINPIQVIIRIIQDNYRDQCVKVYNIAATETGGMAPANMAA